MPHRSVTTLLLAALLILQSVVPCCAISNLLPNGDALVAESLQVVSSCSCCPHSPTDSKQLPTENERPPDEKCPFCGGLLLHIASDDATAPVTESHLIFALLSDAPECTRRQVQTFEAVLPRQIPGHPFLNTGMRLLTWWSVLIEFTGGLPTRV